MSRTDEPSGSETTDVAICQYCGFVIDEINKDRPMLAEGRCRA